MKVLFTFSGLPHYYNLILSRLNNIEGLEIVVVSPQKVDNQTIGKGVYQTKEGINFKTIFLEEYDSLYKKFFKGFDQVIQDEKPDIIVTIFYYAYSFLYNSKVKKAIRQNNVKLIYKDIPFRLPLYENAVHYYTNQKAGPKANFLKKNYTKFQALVYREISKVLYNRFDAHVNYVEKARDVFGSYGVDQRKIFITYNSIDNEVIKSLRKKVDLLPPILDENPYRIFHVGRLVEWKRVEMLIRAVDQLKITYPKIELLIIGDGPLKDDLIQQTKALNIEEHVKFLGSIYDTALLGQYFRSCSLYVLAGMGGLSINETMAWGLPVVCSVCDGTEKHLVVENYNGKFFKEGDVNDLAAKIDYFLSDIERARQMGKNSEELIETKINVHTVMKGYLKAFNFVTNDKYNLKYIAPKI